MAGVAGLEPVTSAVTGQRSIQLSYTPAFAGSGQSETRKAKSTANSDDCRNKGWAKTATRRLAPPAAVSAVAPVTAVTPTAAAGRTLLTRAGNIYCQRPPLKFLVVEHFYSLVGFLGCGHLHEGEAAGFASKLVQHDVYGTDDSRRGKMLLQVIVHRLIGKISDEEARFTHNQYTLAAQKTEWGVAALAVALNVALFGDYRQSVFLTPTPLFFALTCVKLKQKVFRVNKRFGPCRVSIKVGKECAIKTGMGSEDWVMEENDEFRAY